ncbi:MAG: hypothetical protein U5L96_11620 [Owenweeksia sp.]|nr:hypothetical protein [Owenweeksia sp.]
MRNTYSVLSILIMGLVISSSGLKAQQIGIQNSNKDPANPTSICQCDTLGKSPGTTDVTYLLGGNFSSSTEFHYELASPSNNWLTADSLDLIDHSPSGSIVDTFGSGFKDVQLAIPCDAPLGPATLRVRNSNGEISDTIFYIINKIPSPPKIDTIIGGFPNPYTTGVDDWGFCAGDSVALVAETQLGASYQWYLNGAPITGATSDTVYIFNSGAYSLQVDLGACDRFSKDTIINTFLPPVSISLSSSPPVAFQIDNPIPTNVSPDDSVQFCATETVLLQANAPGAGVNVNFSYQWLTDSVTQFGDRIYYKTDTADTLQTVNIDSTNIENPSEQRFYVVIDDGFCRDTSEVYYLYMDTIPRTRIINRNYSQGVLGPQMFGADVCMKDSVILRSEMTGGNWEFQWQRLNTSTNVWQSLPNAVNPGFDGTTRSIQVDTSIKPIQALSFYRLRTSTVTPQGDAVCTFITDSIRVRWFPEYDITFQPDPWVQNVGQDSINFCETDSATIIAPVTPSQLISNSLFYDYQWLRDTLDTTGAFVPAPYQVPPRGPFR